MHLRETVTILVKIRVISDRPGFSSPGLIKRISKRLAKMLVNMFTRSPVFSKR